MPSLLDSEKRPIRIAVVGGGIGGITFCIALLAKEIKFELGLYESSPKMTVIGAGIGMGKSAGRVFEYLGLAEAYAKIASVLPPLEWRVGDQDDTSRVAQSQMIHSSCHRAALLELLASKLPPGFVQFSKRLLNYVEDDDHITLYFKDGTTAKCDILIGADGIHSVVRSQMFAGEVEADPVYSGTVVTRGLIPTEKMRTLLGEEAATSPQLYLGHNRHIVMYPIALGEFVNVVVYKSDHHNPNPIWVGPLVSSITTEELCEGWNENGWGPSFLDMLKAIENPACWALHEVANLPHYSKARVCLIGDAAHASHPYHGSGATIGIEDAIILAELIAHPSTSHSNLSTVLQVYSEFRIERATRAKEAAKTTGKLIEFVTAEFGRETKKIQQHVTRSAEWIWEYNVIASIPVALECLEQALE